jgi:hypothetical protein
MVLLSWQIGNDVLTRQEREGWGAKVIDRLFSDLVHEFPDMQRPGTIFNSCSRLLHKYPGSIIA